MASVSHGRPKSPARRRYDLLPQHLGFAAYVMQGSLHPIKLRREATGRLPFPGVTLPEAIPDSKAGYHDNHLVYCSSSRSPAASRPTLNWPSTRGLADQIHIRCSTKRATFCTGRLRWMATEGICRAQVLSLSSTFDIRHSLDIEVNCWKVIHPAMSKQLRR